MMQTMQAWRSHDLAPQTGFGHRFTTCWRSLSESKMSPVLIIVAHLLVHQTFQMPFIKNNHMVEYVSTALTDPTLGYTVLPWTAKVGQKRQIVAEGASSSKRRVAAAAPSFPRPDRGERESIEQRDQPVSSTGEAYDQFYTGNRISIRFTYLI